jgi:cytochrome c556
MKSLICGASMLSLVLIAGLASSPGGAADEAKAPTIEKIMETLHKGKKSPLNTLKSALKSESPDWDKIQKETKLFATLGADLPKNDPPKGDAASFKTLAKAYARNTKALDEAAKSTDIETTRNAFKKLTSSCTACHEAHKPE